MALLELKHQKLPYEDRLGWYQGQLPDGRWAFAVPSPCAGPEPHWVGTVEDPERCDCGTSEETCTFCEARQHDYIVLTKVTGCYRSAKSAIKALQGWAAFSGGQKPPVSWNCPWTATTATPSGLGAHAPLTPFTPARFIDCTPEGRFPQPGNPDSRSLCIDNHAFILRECLKENISSSWCPQCGETPTFLVWNYSDLPADVGLEWYDTALDDGRSAYVTLMQCSPGNDHWVGAVEDPDTCDCDGSDTPCQYCLMRDQGDLVMTRVTGCYPSAEDATQALQNWVDHPEQPTLPSPWYCPWTSTQVVVYDERPRSLPMPADHFTFGHDKPLSLRPRAPGAPPPLPNLCDHSNMIDQWLAANTMPEQCDDCDTKPRVVYIPLDRASELGGQHGLPEDAHVDWILENCHINREGAMPIPSERGVRIATHLQYRPDCHHQERADECYCANDETIRWKPSKFVLLIADSAPVVP